MKFMPKNKAVRFHVSRATGGMFWYNDKGIKVCGKSELAGVKI